MVCLFSYWGPAIGSPQNSSFAPDGKNRDGSGHEVIQKFEAETPDGKTMSLSVGRERFHAPELLFRPSLFVGKAIL